MSAEQGAVWWKNYAQTAIHFRKAQNLIPSFNRFLFLIIFPLS